MKKKIALATTCRQKKKAIQLPEHLEVKSPGRPKEVAKTAFKKRYLSAKIELSNSDGDKKSEAEEEVFDLTIVKKKGKQPANLKSTILMTSYLSLVNAKERWTKIFLNSI